MARQQRQTEMAPTTGPLPSPPSPPPLYGTPRNPDRETLGHEPAEVARRLRKPLMPWQSHVADVALELDPDTGELWYEQVVVTVPRQSGKTTLILAVMIWRCVMFARRIGEAQTVTYIAQMGKNARRKLEREFIPILRRARGFVEVVSTRARPKLWTEWKPSLNNGSENILFGSGSYLQIEAPTESGSHGDVLDMPVIDEAFSRENDLVEQATDAATVTRRSPQTWIISTAGNRRSRWLYLKVLAGRRAVENPDPTSRTAYFEWAVPPDVAWDDPTKWAAYLPALGHTITLARLIARLAKARANPDEKDPEGFEPGEPGFRRGYLNQWVDPPVLDIEVERVREITPEAWGGIVDPESEIVGPSVIGVAAAAGGASAVLVVAGRNAAGRVHVETIRRDGEVALWFEDTLAEAVRRSSPVAVALDPKAPEGVLLPQVLRAVNGRCEVKRLQPGERPAACQAFVSAVNDGNVAHLGDLVLGDAVLGSFRRDMGARGWEWDVTPGEVDIAPLRAATAAHWFLELAPAPVDADYVAATQIFF